MASNSDRELTVYAAVAFAQTTSVVYTGSDAQSNAAAFLSPDHLSWVFRRETGVTME